VNQQIFLVILPVNEDGTNSTSAEDINDLLANKGLHGATIMDCNDFAEIELHSFQAVPKTPYVTGTRVSLTKGELGWLKTTSTSPILYAEGK